MSRYINVDALWRDVTSNIEDCGDVLEIIERQPTVTINDLDAEIKVTNCNYNDEDSKKGDLISRADVCEILSDMYPTDGEKVVEVKEVDRAYDAILNLPPVQPDNQINLCDSCDYSFPDCPSRNDDVIFGNGIGNDNICTCNKYKPSAQPEIISCGSGELIAQPETNCSEFPNSSDAISRQSAIDACMKYNGYDTVWACIMGDIKRLPSAQPDLSEYSGKLWRNAYERGKRDALEDFDMTEKIDKAHDDGYKQGYLQGKADYERKKGEWIEVHGFCTPGGDPVWACSECGKGVHVYGIEHGTYGSDVSDGQWEACPNCGAMMKEGNTE